VLLQQRRQEYKKKVKCVLRPAKAKLEEQWEERSLFITESSSGYELQAFKQNEDCEAKFHACLVLE
jgi:hypothetical protein